jgi:hypothetical protein
MNLVYTAIYGGYDKLWQPKKVNTNWEYRCYTDKPIEGGHWKIIEKKLPNVDDARASKYIKIMHTMENFDNILWVDGCIEIIGDIDEFVSSLPEGDIVVGEHPINNNINEELKACIASNKDDHKIMINQVNGYNDLKSHVFPQNTIILRRNDIRSCEIWWNEVKNKSKRDQLSFGWAMQQDNQLYSTYKWEFTNKYFTWHKFHNK